MKLFLDDYRSPMDCVKYMHKELGKDNLIYTEGDWTIVRSYSQFVAHIKKYGLPELISFDHDLADAHYTVDQKDWKVNVRYQEMTNEKTGLHCAQWLVEHCIQTHSKLPKYFVHSMNPVGKDNILGLLKNYEVYTNKAERGIVNDNVPHSPREDSSRLEG
jgi:hypothetical protein